MIKLKNILFAVVLCSSLLATAQKKKVAVVTFYANKMIDFKELGLGSEGLLKDVLNLRDNPKFNLTPILEKFHTNFFAEYSKSLPFNLVPEQTVLTNEQYQQFQPVYELSKYDAKDYLLYSNYKYIYEGIAGKKNEEGIAKALSSLADGVLFVEINFGLEKGFGIGNNVTLKMKAFARIALYNQKGEKVFVINESERSKKTALMIGGVPVVDPDKILPMCESALDELMGDLQKRITKIVSKTDKKL